MRPHHLPRAAAARPAGEPAASCDCEQGHALPDGSDGQIDLLYRDQLPKLRHRLRSRLGSADDVNDLIQDAFARLLGSGGIDQLRNPAAFLNRVVRNLLIDRSRRNAARAQHVAYGTIAEIGVAPAQGDAIEIEQMRQRYSEIVSSLPERMRAVFVLHRTEGLSYKEIAARFGISVRTVEWHVAQAIVRIGKGLDCE